MLLASIRQGALVGASGGAVAGLAYGALALGPSVGGSALLGALAGLFAGVVWIVLDRHGPTAIAD